MLLFASASTRYVPVVVLHIIGSVSVRKTLSCVIFHTPNINRHSQRSQQLLPIADQQSKLQILLMRPIKQPIFSVTHKVAPQQDIPNAAFRQSYFQSSGVPSVKELRSLSRNKKKLRYHLFKNKNLVTENQFYSPHRQETSRHYSSYLQLMPLPMLDSKNSLKTVIDDRPHNRKIPKKDPQPQASPTDRKEKREFKLIHQMKKEKAEKAKQKMAEQQQSDVYHKAEMAHIEAIGNKKIQIFAEELHDILHSPPQEEIKSAKASKVLPQIVQDFEPNMDIQKPSELITSTKQIPVPFAPLEQSYRQPDLNRSCLKAQQILHKRRDSISGMDISVRLSKIRQEMNLSLALQSINHTKANMASFYADLLDSSKGKASTVDRLRVHIRILQTMSHFVFESTRFDIVTEQWQQLNFLIYKKYYIQRVKVLNFISKYPMRNPFNIYNAEISSKQVIDFMKTEEGSKFKAEVAKETSDVRGRLASFYGHFDKAKVGEKINLFQYDNFSHWIIQELWAELILTEYNTSHQRQVVQHRMCRILQLIFLISELNGKYEFPFQEAENAIRTKEYQSYIREGKDIFEKYILYKQK